MVFKTSVDTKKFDEKLIVHIFKALPTNLFTWLEERMIPFHADSCSSSMQTELIGYFISNFETKLHDFEVIQIGL